jgi:hypothetical protein
MFYRVVVLVTLVAVACPTKNARAVEVTPYVGAMIPTNSMMITGLSSWFRMKTHTVYGLAVGTSLTQRIGAEAVLGAGTGNLETVGGDIFTIASTMFIADLRAHVRVAGTDRSQLGIILGVGYTDFDTGAFDAAEEFGFGVFLGRLTGIAGVGLRRELSDRVGLRFDIVDRLHDQGAEVFGSDDPEKTQNDIVATIGISYGM